MYFGFKCTINNYIYDINRLTMETHIYLTAMPEALIASMLSPEEFGEYLSTGTKKRNRGQAVFFEVDLAQIEDLIDLDSMNKRCVPKPDGKPKNSVYLSVYRVLEKVPLAAIKSLYITTDNGHTLELKKSVYDPSKEIKGKLHLFRSYCLCSL